MLGCEVGKRGHYRRTHRRRSVKRRGLREKPGAGAGGAEEEGVEGQPGVPHVSLKNGETRPERKKNTKKRGEATAPCVTELETSGGGGVGEGRGEIGKSQELLSGQTTARLRGKGGGERAAQRMLGGDAAPDRQHARLKLSLVHVPPGKTRRNTRRGPGVCAAHSLPRLSRLDQCPPSSTASSTHPSTRPRARRLPSETTAKTHKREKRHQHRERRSSAAAQPHSPRRSSSLNEDTRQVRNTHTHTEHKEEERSDTCCGARRPCASLETTL